MLLKGLEKNRRVHDSDRTSLSRSALKRGDITNCPLGDVIKLGLSLPTASPYSLNCFRVRTAFILAKPPKARCGPLSEPVLIMNTTQINLK